MADPISPEIHVRAIVHEAQWGAPSISNAVASLRKELAEVGPETMLQTMAGRRVNEGTANHVIGENIGTRRKADGTKDIIAGSSEADRVDRATKANALLREYSEKGYDKLTDPQKDQIRGLVETRLSQNPVIQAVLARGSMTDAQRKMFLDRVMADPVTRKAVIEGRADALSMEKLITDKVTPLETQQKRFAERKKELDDEKIQLEQEIKHAKELLELHKQDPNQAVNRLQSRINSAEAAVTQAQTELTVLTQQLNVANRQLKNVEDDFALARRKSAAGQNIALDPLRQEIAEAEDKITKITGQIAQKQVLIQQNQKIVDEHMTQGEKLPAEIAQKEQRLESVKKELREADIEYDAKNQEYLKALSDKAFEEDNFVEGIEGVFGNAAQKWMDDKLDLAIEKYTTYLDKQKATTEDVKKRAFIERLSKRYFKNEQGRQFNKEQIRADFRDLVTNGPDALVRARLAEANYTTDEINKIMTDPTKANEFRTQVIDSTLKFYLTRGGLFKGPGQISAAEAMRIGTSSWGEGAIERGLAGRTHEIENVNKLAGDRIIGPDGKLLEGFRKRPIKNILLVLLAIAGLIGGTVFAAHAV